jgi:8-oxo-dGTP diphosphatase
MIEVCFYDNVDDNLLKFAVIAASYNHRWVFCKHKERDTFELPGGHREAGEDILETANRELFEETGAAEYELIPVCAYSVIEKSDAGQMQDETFGMLFYANIKVFFELPNFEIERIQFSEELTTNWTYPLIQPKLLAKVDSFIRE